MPTGSTIFALVIKAATIVVAVFGFSHKVTEKAQGRSLWAWLVTPVPENSRLKYFVWAAPGLSPLATFLWTLAIMAMASPVIPLVRYLRRPDLGLPASIVAVGLLIIIKISGKLRRELWFWATMILVAGAHVIFILRVPWPDWIPSGILIGLSGVDSLMIFGLIYFVGKLLGKEDLVRQEFNK